MSADFSTDGASPDRVTALRAFVRRFPDDDACKEHLKRVRWGENLDRFVCPDCRCTRGWWLGGRKLVECAECHHQASPTAGTLFHRSHVPLSDWFWTLYLVAQDKKDVAAMELKKLLGVSYRTAWSMLQRIHRAMLDACQSLVLHGVVAIETTHFGGRRRREQGTAAGKHTRTTPAAIAVEQHGGRSSRIALAPIKRADSRCLAAFARRFVATNARIRTALPGRSAGPATTAPATLADAAEAKLPQALPEAHAAESSADDRASNRIDNRTNDHADSRNETRVDNLTEDGAENHTDNCREDRADGRADNRTGRHTNWAQIYLRNVKAMILGTYHSVTAKYLARYLAAFVYRANFRNVEPTIFDRLLSTALSAKPVTFKELTTGAK